MAMWVGPLLAAALILVFLPIAILQWLAIVFLILTAVSWMYSKLVEKQLIIQRLDPHPRAFRLADTTIRIRITNPLPLPIPYLLISDETGGMTLLDDSVDIVSLKAGQSAVLEYRVRSERRGPFTIGPGTVLFSDPLGMFPKHLRISEETELLVLPKVYPLNLQATRGLPIGSINVENRIYEDPSRYRSMRDYVPGDDPRRIHWKASARTNRLQVMEYSSTLSLPVVVALNVAADAYSHGRKFHHFERCIEAAASVCQYWQNLDQEVALLINTPEGIILPRGKTQLPVILETLAGLDNPAPDAMDMTGLLAGFRFSLGERFVLVSPAVSLEEYRRIAMALPRNCDFDYWLLQDRQKRDGYVHHGMQPAIRRHRVLTLEEYGEELVHEP